MSSERILRVFPKTWVDRYGEEFGALLDDLREERRLGFGSLLDVVWLGVRASFDATRSGVSRRLSAPRVKRRLFSFAGVLTLAGGGVGLGLALAAGAAQVSFVAPPPDVSVGVNGATVLAQDGAVSGLAAAHDAACLLPPDYSPSGAQLLTTNEPKGSVGSLYRADVARQGRTGSLHWALLSQAGPLTQSLAPNVRLSAGGLSVADHWYSFCNSFGADGTSASETGLAVVAGGQYHGHHVPGFVYGLIQPSSAKLIVKPSSGPSMTPKIIAKVAGYDLFIAPLSSNPCTFTSLKMLQISPEFATSETTAVEGGCHAFSPLRTGITESASGRRTLGVVQSIGSGELVLRTSFWPSLNVDISATTPTFIEEGPGEWTSWDFREISDGNTTPMIEAGSSVYVSGRVTGDRENATGIYLLTTSTG